MAHVMTASQIDQLFGPGSGSIEFRAANSQRLFVRSQDQLALYSEGATGTRLTALQAYKLVSEAKLLEILDYGSANLPVSYNEPAETLRIRRGDLGLTVDNLSRATGLAAKVIHRAENPDEISPIAVLNQIAQALGLDQFKLGITSGAGGDSNLAVRLRHYKDTRKFTPTTVLALTEAAWAIRQQVKFTAQESMALLKKFEPSSNYGKYGYPVWRQARYLAQETRKILDLTAAEPIRSMRALLERLGVPVIQMELSQNIAGATISVSNVRGIVANVIGENSNPCVRRSTLAHELGHLLWDPDEHLESLIVDDYKSIGNPFKWRLNDPDYYVEARANAFAIEFLAPSAEVEDIYRQSNSTQECIKKVMHTFGISYTAARYQIKNALDDAIKIKDLYLDEDYDCEQEWRSAENYTTDYFPLAETRLSRRGRFAQQLIEAEQSKHVDSTVAASWLGVDVDKYKSKKREILELFTT